MTTKELNNNRKIVKAETEVEIPYLDQTLAFSLPIINGPFDEVMGTIDKNGGLRPTTGQTIALINFSLKNQDKQFNKKISKIFLENPFNYLFTATQNLWGKDDVIVYDNVDGKMPSDRESLTKRYEEGDKAVRIVPRGFRTGILSIDEFLENPYVIAQVGAISQTNKDVERYTVLSCGWWDTGFILGGCYDDKGNYGGYSSRVCNVSALQGASVAKN